MARKQPATQARKRAQPAKSAKRPAKRAAAKPAGGVTGVHSLHEDNPWTIDYDGHDPRKDSPLYTRSRKLLTEIARSTTQGNGGLPWFFGESPGKTPWEDHHGGGLWAYGSEGWFYVRNYAGMEWASQFCADPALVERLRENAVRLYEGFPKTEGQIRALDSSYPFKAILTTPIKAAPDVAQWTDSIFNASMPLPKGRHTGVPKDDPSANMCHGVHHYPTPIWDIELFKRADFTLWVKDGQGKPTAVVPMHARGAPKTDANYGKVAVAYATPGTQLHDRLARAQAKGKTLVADAGHALAKQAFAKQ
jgi:hypothetical protein